MTDTYRSRVRDTRERWQAIEKQMGPNAMNANVNYEQARISPQPADRGKAFNYPITAPLVSSRSLERRDRANGDRCCSAGSQLDDDEDAAAQSDLPSVAAASAALGGTMRLHDTTWRVRGQGTELDETVSSETSNLHVCELPEAWDGDEAPDDDEGAVAADALLNTNTHMILSANSSMSIHSYGHTTALTPRSQTGSSAFSRSMIILYNPAAGATPRQSAERDADTDEASLSSAAQSIGTVNFISPSPMDQPTWTAKTMEAVVTSDVGRDDADVYKPKLSVRYRHSTKPGRPGGCQASEAASDTAALREVGGEGPASGQNAPPPQACAFQSIADALRLSEPFKLQCNACRQLRELIKQSPVTQWFDAYSDAGICSLLLALFEQTTHDEAKKESLLTISALVLRTQSTHKGFLDAGALELIVSAIYPGDCTLELARVYLRTFLTPLAASAASVRRIAMTHSDALAGLTEWCEALFRSARGDEAATSAVLACLEVYGALLVHADVGMVSTLSDVGALRLLCDVYRASHDAQWPAYARWELRKAAVVLSSMWGAGTEGEPSTARVLTANCLTEAMKSSHSGGPAHFVGLLLSDLSLRDKLGIAIAAVRMLHLLVVQGGQFLENLSRGHVTSVGNILMSRSNNLPLKRKPTHSCNQLLLVMWDEGQRLGRAAVQQQVVRCLARQPSLAPEFLSFVHQHAVPRCIEWMRGPDGAANVSLAFCLRNLAVQSADVVESLRRHGLVAGLLDAVREGQPVAIDAVQDLLVACPRVVEDALAFDLFHDVERMLDGASNGESIVAAILALARSSPTATKRMLAAIPRLAIAFKTRINSDDGAARDRGGRFCDCLVCLADVSAEMQRFLLEGTDFVEYVAQALTRDLSPSLYAQLSSVASMPGLSSTLILVTGTVTGVAHATLATPVTHLPELDAIVSSALQLSQRHNSGGGVMAAMVGAKLQPTLLQKAGELIRFVEARQATSAHSGVDEDAHRESTPGGKRPEFKPPEARLVHAMVCLAERLAQTVRSPGATYVAPSKYIGSRSCRWLETEVAGFRVDDAPRILLEEVVLMIRQMNDRHASLEPPRQHAPLQGFVNALSTWSVALSTSRVAFTSVATTGDDDPAPKPGQLTTFLTGSGSRDTGAAGALPGKSPPCPEDRVAAGQRISAGRS